MVAALPAARAAGPSLPESPDREAAGSLRLLLLLAGFVLVWTLYFSITEAPVAIKHDMAEAYAWGRQFQLGYNQHPPFWAWVCGAWFSLLPRRLWAFALLSALNAAVGLWGAWAAIGDFAAGAARRAAFALLLATPLYTFYAYKYDANIIFISIWPWTIHAFMTSLRSRRTRDAAGFGVCAGLALMSKYYALILLFACFLAALIHPARRRYFASAAPYVAMLTALLVVSPHLWWLIAHRAPPLRYLHSITDWPWAWILRDAWQALGGILGMNAAPMALAAWFAWRGGRAAQAGLSAPSGEPAIHLLAVLTLVPPALTLASGLLLRTRIKSEMMAGAFPLLPLLAIALARPLGIDRLARLATRLAVTVSLGALAVAPGFAYWRLAYAPATRKAQPFPEAARAATRIWHAHVAAPLRYVAGSAWYDIETAFYSPDRPHAFVGFDYADNLWVTPAKLARDGLLSICRADDATCLADTARFATPASTRTELTVARQVWGYRARAVRLIVTVIPPGGGKVLRATR